LDADGIPRVMGQMGSGRSTFVKSLLSGTGLEKQVKIGEGGDLELCTNDIQPFPTPILTSARSRLVIVDTPGLDDTNEDDSVITSRIVDWLASS